MTRGWTELGQCLNQRSIGLFTDGGPTVTGNTYYMSGGAQDKQQSLQQIYSFSDSNLTIPINVAGATAFFITKASFTDGTKTYGLSQTYPPLAGQVSATVTETQILISKGPSAPAITSGTLILEWLCNT